MTTGSPPTPLAAPLTPRAALGWLQSLSVDIRAAAVLDVAGGVLAGDPALAAARDDTGLLAARSDRHTILVRSGPKALRRLLLADLRAALDALESG
jgi:hypothetical protein